MQAVRGIDPEMQAQTLAVFLLVGMKPGIPMSEVLETLDISQSSVSRNVSILSPFVQFGVQGLDLIFSESDPHNRRRKVLHLTSKGKRVLETLEKVMN